MGFLVRYRHSGDAVFHEGIDMADFEDKPITDAELKKLTFSVNYLMRDRVRKEKEFEDAKERQLERTQFIREKLLCVAEAEEEAGETSDQREAGMIMLRASAKLWESMSSCVWDYVEWYPMLTKHELDDDVAGELSEEELDLCNQTGQGQYYRLTEFGRLFLDDDRLTFDDVKRLCVQRVNDEPFDPYRILCKDADVALEAAQKERDNALHHLHWVND